MQLLKLSEATAARRRIPVALVDSTDGVTPETGVTLSAGDLKISKNGGAEGNHGGSLVELAGGDYYYECTQGELDTVGYLTGRIVKSGVRTFRLAVQVVAFDPYDGVRAGLTALPNAAAEAAGGLFTRGSGAGQINQSANGQVDAKAVELGADVVTASAVAASAVSEIQSGLATAANLSTVAGYLDTEIADIKAKTDNLPDDPADASVVAAAIAAIPTAPTANQNADALLDRANGVEVGLTPRQAMRLQTAALAGKVTGADDHAPEFRNAVADSKTRISATTDEFGNRTAVTVDLS